MSPESFPLVSSPLPTGSLVKNTHSCARAHTHTHKFLFASMFLSHSVYGECSFTPYLSFKILFKSQLFFGWLRNSFIVTPSYLQHGIGSSFSVFWKSENRTESHFLPCFIRVDKVFCDYRVKEMLCSHGKKEKARRFPRLLGWRTNGKAGKKDLWEEPACLRDTVLSLRCHGLLEFKCFRVYWRKMGGISTNSFGILTRFRGFRPYLILVKQNMWYHLLPKRQEAVPICYTKLHKLFI